MRNVLIALCVLLVLGIIGAKGELLALAGGLVFGWWASNTSNKETEYQEER